MIINWDGAQRAEEDRLCSMDTALRTMFLKVQSLDLVPQFQLAIHDAPCGMHFPRFVTPFAILGTDAVDSLRLTFPRRFLDDVNVGRELVLFMLLHEVGHGARGTYNSLLADDWAARVGLALYHGNRWTPAFARTFLERVVGQLSAYMASQELPSAFGRASPERQGSEEYPMLASRVAAIRGALLAPVDRACNTYSDADFADRLAASESVLGSTYLSSLCHPAPPPAKVEKPEQQLLVMLEDMCDRYPALCDRPSFDPVRVKRGIRVNARQLLDALREELDHPPRPRAPTIGN